MVIFCEGDTSSVQAAFYSQVVLYPVRMVRRVPCAPHSAIRPPQMRPSWADTRSGAEKGCITYYYETRRYHIRMHLCMYNV